MIIASIDFHDGVDDLNVSANESIFSSLYAEWRIYLNIWKCYCMQTKMQKSLLNLSYVQMFASWRSWMHLRAIGRQFTQINAYFLVMNSKRCNKSITRKSCLIPMTLIVLTKAAPAFFVKWSGEYFLKWLCIGNNRLFFLPFY